MDIEFICDMLGGNELVIPNEFSLFEAISRWLMSESHLSSLQEYGNRLLPLIRFPQMFASQLYQLEQVSVKRLQTLCDLMVVLTLGFHNFEQYRLNVKSLSC